MWFAGIDWADQHHDVVVLDAAGARVGQLRVPHSAAGVGQLIAWLRQIGDVSTCPEHLACLIETTHGVLITALLEQGLSVYPVNPKTVDRARKPSGAKTDAIDAHDPGAPRPQRPRRAAAPPAGSAAHPGAQDADPRPGCGDPAADAPDEPGDRVPEGVLSGGAHLVRPHRPRRHAGHARGVPLAHRVPGRARERSSPPCSRRGTTPRRQQKAQASGSRPRRRSSTRLPPVAQAKARYLLALVAHLRLVMQQVAEYDAEIARVFEAHGDRDLFASLPGVGQRIAPRLLAEWGEDRARYASAASVQALAGTAPVIFQSGAHRSTRMRNACSKPLRNVLYQFARVSIQRDAWAKRYYDRKRQEGKTFTMAVRALANQWVRILYAVWQKRAVYDPQVFAQAQQAHGRQAA